MPCRKMAGPRRASRCGLPGFSFPLSLLQARSPTGAPLTLYPILSVLCTSSHTQSATATAKGPKGAPSPGGFDDSTLPLVDRSLGEYRVGAWKPIPKV